MTTDPAQAGTEAPQKAAEPTEPAPEGDDTTADHADQPEPDGRDARYRRKLRAVEAERDQLRDRLAQHQRAEVTRLAGDAQLAKPEAIWAGGLDLADVLDDDGQVDTEKARVAINTVASTLGLALRPRQPRRDPGQGARPDERGTGDNPWGELLRRK